MTNFIKYIGMDVHQASIAVAVLNVEGKLVMQSILATHAAAILDFIHGLRGRLEVTFEEGTQSAWLYDLLIRHVDKVVVCNPRKNALLKVGNKSDKIDAIKLAELLRTDYLSAVYHGEKSTRTLKELVGSYTALTEDTTRIMGRIKALYRSHAIACAGKRPYGKRHRQDWLQQLRDPGLHSRGQRLYAELDAVQQLRRLAKREMMAESSKHGASRLLRTVPFLGPVRVAILIARMQVPHRFRTKRQLWAYCGLALETRSTADHHWVQGQWQRSRKPVLIRGLNVNHNHDLKNVFKGAAMTASVREGPLRDFYLRRLDQGMEPEMARLTLARKIAAVTLILWKKGESFDPKYLTTQAA